MSGLSPIGTGGALPVPTIPSSGPVGTLGSGGDPQSGVGPAGQSGGNPFGPGAVVAAPPAATPAASAPKVAAPIPNQPPEWGPWPPPNAVGFTDQQGRQWYRYGNEAGHLFLERREAGQTENGTGVARVLIDVAPDSSQVKTDDLRIFNRDGSKEKQVVVATFDVSGLQTGETTDGEMALTSANGGRSMTEHTVGTFAAGTLVKRQTDIVAKEHLQEDKERAEAVKTIKGVWDAGGAPITDQTIPSLETNEKVTYITKGGGIYKDTDRILTTEMRAVGTTQKLTYPDPMKIVVRFEGHGDEYIERELSAPLDKDGNPKMDELKVVRDVDKQSTFNKAEMQVRIWGGFASQLSGIVGINMIGTSMHGLGRFLLFGAAGAGVLATAAEGDAIRQGRNDASWARLVLSAYDTTTWGLIAYYVGRGGGLRGQLGPLSPLQAKAGVTALGVGNGAAFQTIGNDIGDVDESILGAQTSHRSLRDITTSLSRTKGLGGELADGAVDARLGQWARPLPIDGSTLLTTTG